MIPKATLVRPNPTGKADSFVTGSRVGTTSYWVVAKLVLSRLLAEMKTSPAGSRRSSVVCVGAGLWLLDVLASLVTVAHGWI